MAWPLATPTYFAEMLIKLQEKYADFKQRRRGPFRYECDPTWEPQMHEHLNVKWPCDTAAEFWRVWEALIAELQAAGIRVGPDSFRTWNDGDAGFVRSIWCLVRHLRPERVIETGVAHGVTSRLILEALKRNGAGYLWSIDLPPNERVWSREVGIAVGDGFEKTWSYMRGSSRRLLPALLSELGQIDLFIHDSLHSERNVLFELDQAYAAVRPGGALVVDDVDVNWGFHSFTKGFSDLRSLICEAEPLRPDLRRFNDKGLFGIVMKRTNAEDLAKTAQAGR